MFRVKNDLNVCQRNTAFRASKINSEKNFFTN